MQNPESNHFFKILIYTLRKVKMIYMFCIIDILLWPGTLDIDLCMVVLRSLLQVNRVGFPWWIGQLLRIDM